jgi:polyprenyl-phospho-N-acetylgalactosaminyl synthase
MSHPIDPRNVFVIIPAYNEHVVIRQVVEQLLVYNYSVVVIDDGSDQELRPLVNNLPVWTLRHRVNLGQGAALQTGIEFALEKQAQYIVTFDADGQHHANDIDSLLQELVDKKAGIVFGSRFLEGATHNMPSRRKTVLQLARYLNYLFTGLLLTDAHNGLRAMTRAAAASIHLRENRMAHATELLSQVRKQKLHYSEIPVHIHYSEYSRKKGQTIWSGFRIFFDLLLNKIFK